MRVHVPMLIGVIASVVMLSVASLTVVAVVDAIKHVPEYNRANGPV